MGRRRLASIITVVHVVFGGGLTACANDEHLSTHGDAGSLMDATITPPPVILDAGLPGVTPCTGPVPVMKGRDLTTNTEFQPDWSCYDEPGAPPDSTPQATFRLDPQLTSFIVGVKADLFFDGSTLGAPAVTYVFDPDAETVTFPLPSGVSSLAVHLHAPPSDAGTDLTVTELYEYGLPIPPSGAPTVGFALLQPSRKLVISMALDGKDGDPEKPLLVSTARDCRGRPVSGARFELIDGETNLPVPTGAASDAPHSSYFQYALPTTTCTFTANEQQGRRVGHDQCARQRGRRRQNPRLSPALSGTPTRE